MMAQDWLAQNSDARTTRMRQAVAERNFEDLWTILEHYLRLERPDAGESSKQTLDTYRAGLRQYLQYTEQTGLTLTALTPLQNYVEWLFDRGNAARSIRTRVTAARHFIRSLEWIGVPNPDGLGRLTFPLVEGLGQIRRPYGESEVTLLLEAVDIEERVIVLLGIDAGLKPGEMLKLRRSDLQLNAQPPQLSLPGPQKTVVWQELTPALRGALLRWCQTWSGEAVMVGRKVSYLDDRIKQLCERAQVQYKGVEGLRLTAADRCYKEKGRLKDVQDFLRVGTSRDAKRNLTAFRFKR